MNKKEYLKKALLLIASIIILLFILTTTGIITFQRPNLQTEQQQAETVFATETGRRYHREGCRHLTYTRIPITLQQARARGLTPCGHCNP